MTDFIHGRRNSRRNKVSYLRKPVHIIDKSSGPTKESQLGKICKGSVRCYGYNARRYPPKDERKEGDPEFDKNFEWVIKLDNPTVDLYMNNERMTDIFYRDGSDDNPYFSLFIGTAVFPRTER